jgi:hypothetical protein
VNEKSTPFPALGIGKKVKVRQKVTHLANVLQQIPIQMVHDPNGGNHSPHGILLWGSRWRKHQRGAIKQSR